MKKRILLRSGCAILAMVMLALPSCNSPDKDADSTPATESTAPVEENDTSSVMNFALSDFQIVRSDKSSSDITDAVVEFNNVLKSKTGVSLKIVTDLSAKKETACEIIIGNTKREASQNVFGGLEAGEYVIRSVKTEDGMKVVVCGSNDNATKHALEQFLTLCVAAYEKNGEMGVYELKDNYYAEFEKFHFVFGNPVVVAQGKTALEMGWGEYQFPNIERSVKGDIIATWSTTTDSLEDLTDVGGTAVSEDGGLTWRERAAADKIMGDVKMPNGRYFYGFEMANANVVDYLDKYTPVYSMESFWDGKRNVYNASQMTEVSNVIIGYEYNPNLGTTESFKSTINWPNMPLVSNEKFGGAVTPLTQVMQNGGRYTTIVKGKDMYMCIFSLGLHPETGEALPNMSSSIWVFKSSDNARTWNLWSYITVPDEAYAQWKNDQGYDGFCEPHMEVVPDGSVVMLIRLGRNVPSYIVRSTDNCKTWSKPEVFDKCGVWPQIMTMGCGVTVATYGRLGLYLRGTSDPSALDWEDPVDIKLRSSKEENSCAYTGLLPLSDTEFLVIYSDFYYPNAEGIPVKTILAMRVTIVPGVK